MGFNIKDLIVNDTVKLADEELISDTLHKYEFSCPPLDILFGGGIHAGKIIELSGWESNGKSTLALEVTKCFCNYWASKNVEEYAVLWIESESALNKPRAKLIGCDLSRFIITEVENLEDGEEIIVKTLEKAVEKGTKLIIIWDTIAAVSTLKEREKGAYAGGMAEKPKMIRAMFRKITPLLAKTNSSFILVNQVYQVIGSYVPQNETGGGGGIKFHASVRCSLTVKQPIKEKQDDGTELQTGIMVEVFSIKNKLTHPKQKCLIALMNEKGLDRLETNIRYLMEHKLIEAAAWKTLKIPASLPKKGEINKEPEMVTKKFMTSRQLEEMKHLHFPYLGDWIEYLIYNNAISYSPLVKLNCINKLWAYEEKFFGCKKTELTEEEKEIAKYMVKEFENVSLDDEETKPKKKKKTPEVVE